MTSGMKYFWGGKAAFGRRGGDQFIYCIYTFAFLFFFLFFLFFFFFFSLFPTPPLSLSHLHDEFFLYFWIGNDSISQSRNLQEAFLTQ